MNSNPLISIIVPVYGVEKYIEECARSIFGQTYDNLEIIFVDDCSPDHSMEILLWVLNEYPDRQPRTHILRHPQNKGVACARLTGLRKASGKYTIQFDSDDFIDRDMVRQMTELAEAENADITICDFFFIYPDRTVHEKVNPPLDHLQCMSQVLRGVVHSSLCNKLIKRDLYSDNGIYPIEGLNQQEDLSVMFRLLFFAKKLAYIPKPFYNYRWESPGSYTQVRMNPAKQENNLRLLQLAEDFRDHHGPFDNNLEQGFAYKAAETLSLIALYGDYQELGRHRYLFRNVTMRLIATHPGMKIHIKAAGLLYKSHCILLLKALRAIPKLLRHGIN